MEKYDIIFLGYPNWFGTVPMAVLTFIEEHDLSGKTIIPFCTHGGSGLGRGPNDIERFSHDVRMMPGLAIRSGDINHAQGNVDSWLRQLGLVR